MCQRLAVDGTLHARLGAPRTHLDDNFTRAYYSASGARVLSGSSEERVVRVHCARTARLLDEAEM